MEIAMMIGNSEAVERKGSQEAWGPRRRGSRLTLDIGVEVYGKGSDGKIFLEHTRTRVVSAYGALVELSQEVLLDQAVVVICKRNRQEMRCRVVYREEAAPGAAHVGIAFETHAPRFWGVRFPYDDSDRTE
jgi:hypothetical protein